MRRIVYDTKGVPIDLGRTARLYRGSARRAVLLADRRCAWEGCDAPAATVDHRDFSSSRVRARVVTDDTALSCGRDSTTCVIQFDPASTARRYRRRLDLVATDHATVVSFVVPEREDEARRLLRSLDAPELLTGPDVPAVADALAPFGVEITRLPLTPAAIVSLLEAVGA